MRVALTRVAAAGQGGEPAASRARPARGWQDRVIGAVAALFLIGLFGRIMAYPLGHDEEIHVAAARLLFREPLYGGLGYNHLPGLPVLLGGIYALLGVEHLLLGGRLLIFLCWLATIALFAGVGRRLAGDARIGLAAVVILAAGPLLGPAGMLVTNNFLPIPCAVLGIYWLIAGLSSPRPDAWRLFGAGVAVGAAIVLKVSYVFLAPAVLLGALSLAGSMRPGTWLARVGLPLGAGGLVGCAPALVPLASDPGMLFAHTVRYFTHAHLAYWQQLDAPKVMSFAGKVRVAQDVWLSGSGLLALTLTLAGATLLLRQGRPETPWIKAAAVPLVAAICAAVTAFAPTPAFPQYYEPPVPFVLLLLILIYARLDRRHREAMDGAIAAGTIVAAVICGLQLLPSLPSAVAPGHWTGIAVHRAGQAVRARLAERHLEGAVATLAPIVPLEGGLPIYPEFGAGPFVYRVADGLPASDRRYFRTTSPRTIDAFLAAQRPVAILVGEEPTLDGRFAHYAALHRYVPVPRDPVGLTLFLRPLS